MAVRGPRRQCRLSRDPQLIGCAIVTGVPKLLVLGGSAFVGRAVVLEGLGRGWDVTTFNRGRGGWTDPRVQSRHGDRLDFTSLQPLRETDWDLVVDTWSGAPAVMRASAHALRDAAARYVYISSGSVYAPPPPPGATESAATVPADPAATIGSYAELKRGAEIALEEEFADRALLARAGLILGPHENVGRLTWWLARMARGGEILCPGPPDLEIQYIDARDLAGFVIDAARAGQSGAFNVVSRRGHATMGSLLAACHAAAGSPDAVLTWVDPDTLTAAGIEPWTELPIWIPPGHEYSGMHDVNVERAHSAGLRPRPVQETVVDTWHWFSARHTAPPVRPDLPTPGIDPDRERQVLLAARSR
jgi:2'-hydroxyisoflavone reductase